MPTDPDLSGRRQIAWRGLPLPIWRALCGVLAIVVLLAWVCPGAAVAGQLGQAALQQHLNKRFGDQYVLGERLAEPPVWPVFERQEAERRLAAWLFESVDIEPVQGYAGHPINLLITLAPDGGLLDVSIYRHREPIFKSPAGNRQLADFTGQYTGLSIDTDIRILNADAAPSRSDGAASLQGIARGTITASAIDRTIMWTAVRVAEASLPGVQPGRQTLAGAAGRRQRRLDWSMLIERGLIRHVSYTGEAIGELFGKAGATLPAADRANLPAGAAIDYWLIPVAMPTVGQSLLEPRAWELLQRSINKGHQPVLMLDAGEWPLTGTDDGVASPRAVPMLEQDGRVIRLEQIRFLFDINRRVPGEETLVRGTVRLFQTEANDTVDITRPFTLITRPVPGASVLADVAFRDDITLSDPERSRSEPLGGQWRIYWVNKRVELIILGIGLLVLTLGLIAQHRLSRSATGLAWFRTLYLLFTLCFIGWYAQGQLTIVTVIAALQAVTQGQGMSFMLADPIAVVLWIYVLLSLFIWGRGTFCGWLCPFGAFQELINGLAERFGWRRRQWHTRIHRGLRWLKYAVLGVLIALALGASAWTDVAVEVEPFKTAISLGFQRSWPYVAWAVACLALSLLVYRGYCRYLCPLGAALALLGRVRLFAWIARRPACGTPCQSCRFRCTYQAISTQGRVDYAECFQCLDCVTIYQDEQRCMPLILARRPADRRAIPIVPAT